MLTHQLSMIAHCLNALRKYRAVFSLSLQQEFHYRASFLMDRARSITIVIAFYAFWSTIFQERTELLNYSKSQMFTYVLGMNILRALVFSDKTWEMAREINTGRISYYLIRPISYIGYASSKDIANKVTNSVSSLIEVLLAIWILSIPLYIPSKTLFTLFCFTITVFLAMILYFLMSYSVCTLAFWTAESGGPRFCFELFLEFMAGAFFPLDVLPATVKTLFQFLPFSSLIYFPLNVFLERMTTTDFIYGLMNQLLWIFVFLFVIRIVWNKGLRAYAAQGG